MTSSKKENDDDIVHYYLRSQHVAMCLFLLKGKSSFQKQPNELRLLQDSPPSLLSLILVQVAYILCFFSKCLQLLLPNGVPDYPFKRRSLITIKKKTCLTGSKLSPLLSSCAAGAGVTRGQSKSCRIKSTHLSETFIASESACGDLDEELQPRIRHFPTAAAAAISHDCCCQTCGSADSDVRQHKPFSIP